MNRELIDWRPLTSKRANDCIVCGLRLEIGQRVLWSPSGQVIKCLDHGNSTSHLTAAPIDATKAIVPIDSETPLNLGTPGGSAQAKAERLVKAREVRAITKFPKIGKFLLAVIPEPQSTKAWQAGAEGEIGSGNELERLASRDGFKVLHDRLIPGSRANIDHIAVTKSGIFIIDAKNYSGRIRIIDSAGFLEKANPKLYVGSRNCTKQISGMHHQIDIVKRVLLNQSIDMPVTGILAFWKGNWELLSSLMPQEVVEGVLINNKGIEKILNKDGSYTQAEIERVTRILATKLKPAS